MQTITHKFFLLTNPTTDTWTDITADVLLRDSKWTHGIMSSHPLNRVASVGKLRMILRNDSVHGSQYRYTPGHANCMAGFGVKAKVKVVSYWRDYQRVSFVGWIPPNGIRQSPTPFVELVSVDVYDWMYFALNNQVTLQEIGVDKTLGEVGADLAALVEAQPSRIEQTNYSEVFANTNDTVRENTTILGELSKATNSEMGYAYIKYERDTEYLDILMLEGRETRDGVDLLDYYPLLDSELNYLTTEGSSAREMTVANAGTSAVNGVYAENGTNGGKAKYTKGDYNIFWDSGIGQWYIGVDTNVFTADYTSANDVATPNLCTTWSRASGDDPVPTVVEHGDYLTDEAGNTLLIDDHGTFEYVPQIINYQVVNGAHWANRVSGKAYPREVGAESVIFTLFEPIKVEANTTYDKLRIRYFVKDGFTSVSASGVSLTDFAMNAQADGLGADLTADLTVTPDFGSGDAMLSLENTGDVDGYVTVIEVSGTPIYIADTVTQVVDVATEDDTFYGKIEMLLDQKYQEDPTVTLDQITLLAARYSTRTNTIESITFCASTCVQLASVYMFGDISTKIPLQYTEFAIDEIYTIQGMEVYMRGNATFCKLYVKPAHFDTYKFWKLGTPGSSELGTTTMLGSDL